MTSFRSVGGPAIESLILAPDTNIKYVQDAKEKNPTFREIISVISPSIGTRMFFAPDESLCEEWLDSLEDAVLKGKLEEEKRKRQMQ